MTPELARLVAGYICLHSAMAGTRMAAPLLALTLGYDKAAVGVLLALFALPQVVLALPAGRWTDRRGVKVPIRASVVVCALGAAIAVAWPIYPVLCVSALCSGAGIAAAAIALQRHVGRAARTPTQLKQAFSWLSMAPALSNFVGPFATGFAIDHAGYRGAFVVLAVLPVIGWLCIRATQELPDNHAAAANGGTAWALWREPGFRRLLLLNWFTAASFDVHGFVVPVLGHERGFSASVIGSILGSFAIAAAAVRVAMPFMAARLREWMMISVALGVAALSFFVYPFVSSPIAMALCSAAIGLSVGAVQPMVMSLLHQITPPHRHGQAVAMRLLMINASSVAMPVLFGAAGGFAGVSALFWMMGVVVGTRKPARARVAYDRRRRRPLIALPIIISISLSPEIPMPMSNPETRREIHHRTIDVKAFARDDGLYDVEAHLVDRKPFAFWRLQHAEAIPAGQPLHDFWVRLTVDDRYVVRAIEAASCTTPFELCKEAESTLSVLVGERFAAGWSSKVKSALRGAASCTHLMEMLITMATPALQGIRGLAGETRRNDSPDTVVEEAR